VQGRSDRGTFLELDGIASGCGGDINQGQVRFQVAVMVDAHLGNDIYRVTVTHFRWPISYFGSVGIFF
jgi:hypothetical protein